MQCKLFPVFHITVTQPLEPEIEIMNFNKCITHLIMNFNKFIILLFLTDTDKQNYPVLSLFLSIMTYNNPYIISYLYNSVYFLDI